MKTKHENWLSKGSSVLRRGENPYYFHNFFSFIIDGSFEAKIQNLQNLSNKRIQNYHDMTFIHEKK